METLQIEILDPTVTSLLLELEKKKRLIVRKTIPSDSYRKLRERLKAVPGKRPSLEEIQKEVDIVRQERYSSKNKN